MLLLLYINLSAAFQETAAKLTIGEPLVSDDKAF